MKVAVARVLWLATAGPTAADTGVTVAVVVTTTAAG